MADLVKKFMMVLFLWLNLVEESGASEFSQKSFHLGFLHPNGVDLIGYTVESKVGANLYRYYTFGIPSLAATGISYYDDYQSNGFTATLGVGIGSVVYGSVGFQLRLKEKQYLKIGAGLTTSIVYNGLFSVLAFENRF